MKDKIIKFSISLLLLICATIAPLTIGKTSVREKQVGVSRRLRTTRPKTKQSGYGNLISNLRSKGATVKPSNERVSQPFFSVSGRILIINGQAAQVFEFAKAATAAAETKRVGDGATTSAAWIAPPHFYHRGRLIVLFVGDNQTVLKLLTTVLGPQFAGQ